MWLPARLEIPPTRPYLWKVQPEEVREQRLVVFRLRGELIDLHLERATGVE
jgi:hypothetical protein